ncbi:hypothetical protein BZG00_00040 [Salinivibrio kushneri]|uniref:DUF2726 domain-containing protein n=1 Tax=Salinivibrio kushneri TaxID=1908198 RepID=A0AB36K048_9GAMM|nr:DUF2726 domain-containing protein [Salinivibrio kushneri]OOE41409.1 hypothetical protein BZG00_00040 [Salinivibrio kushneri]QCP01954.1 DUF2726 domain-containing protein [Salinivibrio kushneri]
MLYLGILIVFIYLVWKFTKDSQPTNTPLNRKEPSLSREMERSKHADTQLDNAHPHKRRVEHKRQSHLATRNEQKLYFALQNALPSDYVIHSQVSLMALVKPVNFRHNSRTWAKRMDFVITDKTTRILAVIELDDATHQWKKRQERDQYVNEALFGHHKLIRIPSASFYEPSKIADILSREVGIKCNNLEEKHSLNDASKHNVT